MSWEQLGGSLAAILVLAWVARLLKLGESRITDPARACELAENMLAGFEAKRAIVSEDGGAALVAGNGTIALLKRHGARVAIRRLVPPLRIREAVEGVAIDTGERLFGAVTLTGVLVDDVRALEMGVGAHLRVVHSSPTVRPELVEGLPFFLRRKGRASTSSARTVLGCDLPPPLTSV